MSGWNMIGHFYPDLDWRSISFLGVGRLGFWPMSVALIMERGRFSMRICGWEVVVCDGDRWALWCLICGFRNTTHGIGAPLEVWVEEMSRRRGNSITPTRWESNWAPLGREKDKRRWRTKTPTKVENFVEGNLSI